MSQATRDLITSVIRQARYTRIVLHLTERARYGAPIDRWRRAGVEVTTGPLDLEVGPGEGWGVYSHVLLSLGAVRCGAYRWAEQTQPQAARILHLPRLPWRSAQGLGPVTTEYDWPGLESEISVQREFWAKLMGGADALWCQDESDAVALRSWVPGPEVFHVPPALEPSRARVGYSDRRGVVISAVGGYDHSSGADEAAIVALSEVVPALRRLDPVLSATLISDGLTASLKAAVGAAGAEVLAAADMARGLAFARAAICVHTFGTGQRPVIEECVRYGTPFVANHRGAGGLEFGPGLVSDRDLDPAEAAIRVRRLLHDEAAWSYAVGRADEVASLKYSREARGARLEDALSTLGISSSRAIGLGPVAVPSPASRWNPRAKQANGLRPSEFEDMAPWSGETPEQGDERYRIWAERHIPAPDVAAAILRDIERSDAPPFFSVLMPVYNSDPEFLREAINSVRNQIYGGWELCIGNDGSDRPETLLALADIRSDPRVKVADRSVQGGISAATNSALSLATGDYVAFLDHDDLLKPHALAQMARWIVADPSLDLVYSDEDILGADGLLRDPHLKPDWSPDQLMAQNYICHLTVVRRTLVESVGGLRTEFDGSQDYDLLLRVTEQTEQIGHVPEPLYSWRAAPGSFAADLDSKPYAIIAGERALADALRRRGYPPLVETVAISGRYRARYPQFGQPKVSIVIPTRNRLDLLKRCVDSIRDRSTYSNYELVIVDNQSTEAETLGYLASQPWRVIRYPHAFNYARLTNLAAGLLETDALLFLNNDTEVLTPDWIEALLEHGMRPEVGAVGARLFFGDGRPQHEGIMIGTWGDWANNVDHRGYFSRGEMVRNTSAVTGACCMIRPSVYQQVGGADPRLRVAYNDVDLCLRLRRAGYEIVYTPYAELYHYEGSSRQSYQNPEDAPLFNERWDPRNVLDPYYSPVFSDAVPFEVSV